VRSAALGAGLDDVGVCSAEAFPEMERLHEWTGRGYNAGMTFMEKSAAERTQPGLVLQGARSCIVVVKSYLPPKNVPVTQLIARYALGRSYHTVLEGALAHVAQVLRLEGHAAVVHADRGPVMEKTLAVRSGLGWQGENGLVHHPRFGSWIVLGGVLTDADLTVAAPQKSEDAVRTKQRPCSGCGQCVVSCPTGALLGGGLVDARRCVSYWTIEARGRLRPWQRAMIRDQVYGCDLCQEVCPANRTAQRSQRDLFAPYHGLQTLAAREMVDLGEERFMQKARGSVLERLGWKRLARNFRAAMENEAPLHLNR